MLQEIQEKHLCYKNNLYSGPADPCLEILQPKEFNKSIILLGHTKEFVALVTSVNA